MSALRDAADAMLRRAAFIGLSAEQLLATERAAARLENRRVGGVPAGKRLLRERIATLWRLPAPGAADLAAQAGALGRRSIDRALILAWLRCHPAGSPDGEALRAAASAAADRHDWVWRDRASRWRLFEADAPARLRAAIATGTLDDPALAHLLEGSAILATAA